MERYIALAEAIELAKNNRADDRPRAIALARAYNYATSTWWSFLKSSHAGTEFFVFGTISADGGKFIEDLAPCHGHLIIRINSPGGDTLPALKIGRWLQARGNCTGIVTGRCDSAANLILAGCQNRIMRDDAGIMLHAVRMAVCDTAPKLRSSADELESYVAEAAEFLAERSGQTTAQVIAWLTGPELYLNATEARALGLVHKISAPSPATAPAAQPLAQDATPIQVEACDDSLAYELARALASLKVNDREMIKNALPDWGVSANCRPVFAFPGRQLNL